MSAQYNTNIELQQTSIAYQHCGAESERELVLKTIYQPIYWLVRLFGILDIKKNDPKVGKKLKPINCLFFVIFVIPIMASGIYIGYTGKDYKEFTLLWAQQMAYSTYKLNGVIGVVMYFGLAQLEFFSTFIEMIIDYKKIDNKNFDFSLKCKKVDLFKLVVLAIAYIAIAGINSTINFVHYDENLLKHELFKTSIFGKKYCYVIDIVIMIMAHCIAMLFISLFLLTYWAVQNISTNFTETTQKLVKADSQMQLQENLNTIALKNTKLIAMFNYVTKNLENFTNTFVMNSIIIIIMSCTMLSLYNKEEPNQLMKAEAFLQIISSIMLGMFLLKSIALTHANFNLDVNSILYSEQIWFPYSQQLHSTANSIILRINAASYTSKIVSIIPANESIVPAIVLLTLALSMIISQISSLI